MEASRAELLRHQSLVNETEAAQGVLALQDNGLRGFVITGEERFAKDVEAKRADVLDRLARIRGIGGGATDVAARMDAFEAAFAAWQENVVAPVIAAAANEATYADALFVMKSGAAERSVGAARKALEDFKAQEARKVEALAATRDADAQKQRLVALAGFGFIAVASAAFGCALLRKVAMPLARLDVAMQGLASGSDDVHDLPNAARRDEIGRMTAAVGAVRLALGEKRRLEGEVADMRTSAESARSRETAATEARAEDVDAFLACVENGFDRLSKGDLGVRLGGPMAAGFEPAREKFNGAIAALEETLGAVAASVESMRSNLERVGAAADGLAQGNEQQAASLQQTIAALSGVKHGVNETAEGAAGAANTATTALRNAEKGGTIVHKAVTAMGEIERSSDQIGRIVGVIDEIAFQTNLLALNAGVEAARAGEAGRGFAVVAQEVRGLAQRSADAAREIKALIQTSRTQVGQGVELVTTSGRSLDEILSTVSQMASVIGTIAASARTQSGALREVWTAAERMDKATRQNAASVAETTAAAQALAADTQELAMLAERFRFRGAQKAANDRRNARPESDPSPVVVARTTAPPAAGLRSAAVRGGAMPAPISRYAEESWEEF